MFLAEFLDGRSFEIDVGQQVAVYDARRRAYAVSDEMRGAVVQVRVEQTGESLRGVAWLHCGQHAFSWQQLHAREQRGRRQDHLLGAVDSGKYRRGGFA